MLEETLIHLPILALLMSTMGRLGGFESQRVNAFQRQIQGNITQLTGTDILFSDLWIRLTDVAGTEGSLVIGEFDEGQFGSIVTFDRDATEIELHVTHLRSRTRLWWLPLAEELLDFFQFFEDFFLPGLQGVNLLFQVLIRGLGCQTPREYQDTKQAS